MPWSRTADHRPAVDAARSSSTTDPGSGVLDRVVEQVDDRRHQLALVAQHERPRLGPGSRGPRPRAGRRGRRRARRRWPPRRRMSTQVSATTPPASIRDRSSRSSISLPARSASDSDVLGQAADDLRVVLVDERLGQHAEGPDRGAQLVADVGREVAPDRFQPAPLGDVLDEGDGAEGPAVLPRGTAVMSRVRGGGPCSSSVWVAARRPGRWPPAARPRPPPGPRRGGCRRARRAGGCAGRAGPGRRGSRWPR